MDRTFLLNCWLFSVQNEYSEPVLPGLFLKNKGNEKKENNAHSLFIGYVLVESIFKLLTLP